MAKKQVFLVNERWVKWLGDEPPLTEEEKEELAKEISDEWREEFKQTFYDFCEGRTDHIYYEDDFTEEEIKAVKEVFKIEYQLIKEAMKQDWPLIKKIEGTDLYLKYEQEEETLSVYDAHKRKFPPIQGNYDGWVEYDDNYFDKIVLWERIQRHKRRIARERRRNFELEEATRKFEEGMKAAGESYGVHDVEKFVMSYAESRGWTMDDIIRFSKYK